MTARLATAFLLAAFLLPAQALVEGRAGSRVRVLIYEDLQCSDCAAFREMMDRQVLPKYGDRVEFIHRDFPLAKHPNARPAAIAARFFSEKDAKLGLEYRRYTLSTLQQTTPENFLERLKAFAAKSGIAPDETVAALQDARLQALVEKDFQDGVNRGIARTPTVLVNGTPFVETFSFEELAKGIDAALAQTR